MDDGWAERNADGLLVVLLPYVLVGIPLNLYLYHDVIDKRWRIVRGIFVFCVVYGTLAASSLGLLAWYATVQFYAEDFKEFGAAVLSCTLALYGLYLCARQVAILVFYRRCLRSRAYAIKQEYVRGDRLTLKSKRFFPGRRSNKGGPSYGKLASVFLDDNYPGEGPRVTWLSWNPEVRDWPEMVVRAGLWIRLAIIPPNLSFYSALRPPLDPGSIVTTTESIGLWTVSSLKLAFLHPQHEDLARSWKNAVPLKDFENCVKGKKGTFERWQKGLSLAPASEWSQALSELPSGWIEGLDTPDVAWEVFLALALHTSAPEPTATSPVTSEDIKKRVEDCVRETLFQHHGHITTNVLMGAFPDSDPQALEWIKRVLTCSDESSRLAALMKRKQGLAGMTLCVGVDLVVALALRLGVTPESLKFSPRQNWGGLHDVLTSRRNHVLLQLEDKAELLLKSSLARYELKLGRHQPSCDLAQATYSLGALLIGKEKTAEGKGLCDKACSIWEKSGDPIDIAKGLSKKAELLMQLMPVNTAANGDIQEVEHLLTSARQSAPDDVKTVCKIAELLMKQGENDKAQQLWEHCLDVCEKAPTDEHRNIVQILKNLASVMQAKGRFTDAELLFARAVETSEIAFEKYHPEVADGLNKQATVSKILHDLKKAERLHRRALDIDLTAYGHRHRVVGRDFVSCADILRDQGEYQKADIFYQQAIDVGETAEAIGPRDPELATWYQSRGILLKIEGKYPDATALFQRSLSIRKGFFGVPHPDVAESLDKLAELEEIKGSFDTAKRLYEEAQAIRKEALGPDHLDFLRHSAEIFKKEGELDNAGALYEQIQSVHEKKLGRRHPEVATALTERAGVLAKKGEYIEADDLYEQALEIDKHTFGDNHPTVARDLCSQAMVRISQERYSDAEARLQRSLTIRKNALGQAHPEVARTLKFWADSLLLQRKDDEAAEKHKQAVKIMEGVMGPEHDDTFNQEGWLDREVLKIAAGGLLSRDMPWYEVLGLQNVAFSGNNVQAAEFLEHHVNDGPLAKGTERILAPALGAFKSVVHAAKEATGDGEDDVFQLVELCLGISRYLLGAASVDDLGRIHEVLRTITDGIKTAQRSINRYNARMQCFHGLVFKLKYRRSLASHKRKLAALLDSLMDDTSFLQKAGQLAREIADGQALVLAELAAVPLDCPDLPPAFVERTQLAKDLIESLLDPGRPSSDPRGLLGLAGGGKTVLAASVVRDTRIRKSFKHGVLWVRVGRGGKDNIGSILEGLARRLGPALSLPRQTSADVRNITTEVGGHLQKAIADGGLRCLVVLDDVWHVDVVKAVTSKGFYVLVTSRDREVVSRGLGVDVVSDDDALELLRKSSGAYGAWPSETALEVADECDLLPLSLALAGSSVKGNPQEAASWQRLLQNLRNSPDKIRRMGRGALFFSIHESIAALDELLQRQLLLLGVMAPGVSASPQMLANLWNTDISNAESTAATLARRFLLQKEEAAYHVHDVVLDFLQLQLKQDKGAEGLASSRQARYLAKTSVLKEYSDRVQGEYHLVSLWNSIKLDRSVNVADCYDENLNGVTDPDLWRRAGKLLALLGFYSSAEGMLKRALKLAEISGTDKRAIAGTLSDSGSVLASQGKSEEAWQQYLKSQDILEQELGADDPDVAECINNLAGLLKMQGKYGEAALLYKREEMILEAVKGSEVLDIARLHNSLAELYEKQGKYEDAELFYEGAFNVREASLGRHHPQVASSLNNRAGLLYAQGKYAEAEPLYERSQAIQEKVLGLEHPDVATTLNNRAELLRVQGKYAEAEPLYERCQTILEKVLDPEHPHLAATLNNRAELLRDQGKYAEADSLYERSQAIREKVLGLEHPDVAATLNNRAGLLYAQGKYAEAEPLYERSQAIQEKVLGPEHPDVATTLNNRAGLMEILGKYELARALYVRANKIWEAALGPDHPDVAAGLSNWAELLRVQGKFAEADPLYLRAIEIGEKTLGPDHPALATRLNNRAELLRMQGKYEEAEPLYRRSLAIDEKVHGPDHPDVATGLNNWAGLLRDQDKFRGRATYERSLSTREKALRSAQPDVAQSLDNQGKYDEAEPLYERCQTICERVLGPEHPRLAATLNNRAELLRDQGKHTEAATLMERALKIRMEKLGEDHQLTMNTRTLLQQVRAVGSAASSGSSTEPSDDDASSATGGVEEVKAMCR